MSSNQQALDRRDRSREERGNRENQVNNNAIATIVNSGNSEVTNRVVVNTRNESSEEE